MTKDEDLTRAVDYSEGQKTATYKIIKRILEQNGYKRHSEKYFTFVKSVLVQGVVYGVDVEFLSGKLLLNFRQLML